MIYTSGVSVAVRRSPSEALAVAISKLPDPFPIPTSPEIVLIKPSIYDPSLVGNTDIRMIQSLLRIFANVAPIYIVESDNPVRTAEDAFSKMNYTSLVSPGVNLLNLSKDETTMTKMPGYFFSEHDMPQSLVKSTFFVNAATLKVEPEICGVGASIKNLFGLLPEKMKSQYHERITDVLLDLLVTFRPNFTVVDLTEFVVGNRKDGKTQHLGGVVIGFDPVAVDSYCANLFGIDPLSIPYLRRAHELGLGIALPERIKVHGTAKQKLILEQLEV